MNIVGKITGIAYKVLLTEDLKGVEIENFDINEMPSSCLLTDNKNSFAISKWVSPKRTRSYPFERVFNTLNISKKITVIPNAAKMPAFIALVQFDNAIADRFQETAIVRDYEEGEREPG